MRALVLLLLVVVAFLLVVKFYPASSVEGGPAEGAEVAAEREEVASEPAPGRPRFLTRGEPARSDDPPATPAADRSSSSTAAPRPSS